MSEGMRSRLCKEVRPARSSGITAAVAPVTAYRLSDQSFWSTILRLRHKVSLYPRMHIAHLTPEQVLGSSMKKLLCAAAGITLAVNAPAIVVQDYPTAESAPGGLDWNFVYNYKGSSAVAVGGRWVLTAAHVADDAGSGTLSVDGCTYTQQEIVYHPEADLALVRFDMPFPGHYSLYTGDLVGIDVLLVGFGNTGGVGADYWTMGTYGKGARRWGRQQIDSTRINRYDADGLVGYTKNYGFWMDFNLGNTCHEAGTATGDSGSGVFFKENGTWKLAGINTSVSGSGGQYNSTFAICMLYYDDWIGDTITSIPFDDADGDGLSNSEENALGTDPLNVDTDNDLLSDFVEVDIGLNPLVSNTGVDSDEEGLCDVDEVIVLGTNPLHPDTDLDGLTDSYEVNIAGTDPLNSDTDGDRLNDGSEVHVHSTLPDNEDTDGDNTNDGDEVLIYGTDPADPASDFDLDDDLMADSWEVSHFTSADNCHPASDPDGDFYFNLEEFRNGTDPNSFEIFIRLWKALKLEWNAASGSVYQVQMCTSLVMDVWSDIGDPVTGSNTTAYLLDSMRENESKCYRVIGAEVEIKLATELEWKAAPGIVYQIQMSTNEASGTWHDLGEPIEGSGQTHYTLDPTHPGKKAYRVKRIDPLSSP